MGDVFTPGVSVPVSCGRFIGVETGDSTVFLLKPVREDTRGMADSRVDNKGNDTLRLELELDGVGVAGTGIGIGLGGAVDVGFVSTSLARFLLLLQLLLQLLLLFSNFNNGRMKFKWWSLGHAMACIL